jgi:hypothetical protein
VAWDAAVPVTRFAEGQYGRADDRGGAEPEAIVEREGVGTAPVAGWRGRFRCDRPANLHHISLKRESPDGFTNKHRRFRVTSLQAESSAADFFTGQSH